jgi:hypothetical protein
MIACGDDAPAKLCVSVGTPRKQPIRFASTTLDERQCVQNSRPTAGGSSSRSREADVWAVRLEER